MKKLIPVLLIITMSCNPQINMEQEKEICRQAKNNCKPILILFQKNIFVHYFIVFFHYYSN